MAANEFSPDEPAEAPAQESLDEGAAPPPEEYAPPQDDTHNRLAAIQAQIERTAERNAYLERSFDYVQRYEQQQAQRQAHDPELELLDRALSPLLERRLAPIVRNSTEQTDALVFENFLSRNMPEVFENEDDYARTMQQVEAIRQAAVQRGMNVSRVDAFVFNQGLQGTRQKITARKQKRGSAAGAEARRLAEAGVAQSTAQSGAPRAPANSQIQAIRQKANRGERLTPDERIKLRDFVSNVQF